MNWKKFDQKYGFSGELGALYQPEKTVFRVWAPACEETGVKSVALVSYGKMTSLEASPVEVFSMNLGTTSAPENHAENKIGLWELELAGDQLGLVYSYRVAYADGREAETQDPYSTATIVNGGRSVVAQMDSAELGKAAWRLDSPTEAIIEEVHVRDFSISETSGISANLRGKFLGLVETSTINQFGDATGLDYLTSLGVNVIQLMPVFDFASVDETRDRANEEYNWGYDPQNYNTPEGSYASIPQEPLNRVRELKTTIQKLHKAGFNVVMDVVYNHVFDRADSSFEKLVPGYYFRESVATGCGNDTASEREMFSKFIVDSVAFWAKKYGFDGFRFDLMGCLDVNTMNKVRASLDQLDQRILVYGEGWDMPTDLPASQKATQKNLGKMPRIGAFNDAIRDTIKGSEFERVRHGFVDGLEMRDELAEKEKALELQLVAALKGSKVYFRTLQAPEQMINYVEAHDNLNLNDQLWKNHPDDSADMHFRRIELATALNLLAEGVPFMEIGQSFERSKLLNHDWLAAENSYKSGDAVNAVNWDLVTIHKPTLDFVKAVIAFRKANPVFRLRDFKSINSALKVQHAQADSGFLIYSLTQGKKRFKLVVNASGRNLKLKTEKAVVRLSNSRVGIKVGDELSGMFEVSDLSISVFTAKGHLYAVD